MLQTPILTEQNLKDYERDGFVVVRSAFNAADMAKIERWTVELAALPEESGKQWVCHEQSGINPDENSICRLSRDTGMTVSTRNGNHSLKKTCKT